MSNDDHLVRPDTADVSGRSARGILWSVGTNSLGYAARLASIPVLARLLTPDDYGLVAMVTAVTGLIAVLGTLGLSEAVLQQRHLTQDQASTLFWVNVAAGAALAAITALCSPLLALLYGRPEVAAITAISAIGFAIAGLGVQHQALMLRKLMHRQAALRQIASVLVGVVVAVVAAALGAGYWALVAQPLVQTSVMVVLAWVAVPWRPSRPRRGAGVREMLKFGSGVSTFQVVNYIGRNADNVLIGVSLGATALGLYGRAYAILVAPLQQIYNPVGTVVRPTLAALWPEPDRFRRHYLAALRGLTYLCMPLVAVLAVLSEPVVLTVLGPEWAESASVFRWLAVAGFVQTISFTTGWLFASSGRAWAWARWGLVSRTIDVIAFVIGLQWGITGVAIAYAIAETLLTPIGVWLAVRGTPVRMRDVGGAIWRPVVLAAVGGAVALAVLLLVDAAPWAVMLVGLLAAGGVVAGLALLWPATRRDVRSMKELAARRSA